MQTFSIARLAEYFEILRITKHQICQLHLHRVHVRRHSVPLYHSSCDAIAQGPTLLALLDLGVSDEFICFLRAPNPTPPLCVG